MWVETLAVTQAAGVAAEVAGLPEGVGVYRRLNGMGRVGAAALFGERAGRAGGIDVACDSGRVVTDDVVESDSLKSIYSTLISSPPFVSI